jgi:hypothetical protein
VPDFTSRREFLKAGSAAGLVLGASRLEAAQAAKPRAEDLARLMTAPVLRRELLTSPVRIESIELIKARDQFLVRARSTDGAIGLSVGHPDVLEFTSPILAKKVAPFFVKKDARDLETLLD